MTTLNPPVTPFRSDGGEEEHQSRSGYDDSGDFEDSPNAPAAASHEPQSSSFEAARLPRFS